MTRQVKERREIYVNRREKGAKDSPQNLAWSQLWSTIGNSYLKVKKDLIVTCACTCPHMCISVWMRDCLHFEKYSALKTIPHKSTDN